MRVQRIISLGVLLLVLGLSACSRQDSEHTSYQPRQHIAYTSSIDKAECLICGENNGYDLDAYWGQDNVGLLDLNTAALVPVEINRYDHFGQLIETATGTVRMGGGSLGDATASLMLDVDRGCSYAEIRSAESPIDPEAVGTILCQECLDTFTGQYYEGDQISSVALVSFSSRELRPLLDYTPWFGMDNYLISCTFKGDSKVNLLIAYRPIRYHSAEN